MKAFYIDTQGIIKVIMDCPEELKPSPECRCDSVVLCDPCFSNRHSYNRKLQAAKDSAVECADQEQAAKLLFSMYHTRDGMDDVDWVFENEDTIHPFPLDQYKVELKGRNHHGYHSCCRPNECYCGRKVAVITPLKEEPSCTYPHCDCVNCDCDDEPKQEERIPVYSTPEGKLYIKPEELFGLKRVQDLILKISEKQFNQ